MTMLSVLYVDDDADIRTIAELSLCLDPSIRVRLAKSGAEALEHVREEVPDIVLLDLMMPGMDGRDTLRALREIVAPVPPVAFVTARTQPIDKIQLTEMGAVGIISKPFDPLGLSAQVRELASLDMALR